MCLLAKWISHFLINQQNVKVALDKYQPFLLVSLVTDKLKSLILSQSDAGCRHHKKAISGDLRA
ncbi:hypothetical protein [Enterobacter sp.]|uniref:hypothetical protein n=1 Tax=Enterobacter sp. TaxID=42895 RepID=UPI00296F9028|nr:hypothetical protein [Enterobacter sp.]